MTTSRLPFANLAAGAEYLKDNVALDRNRGARLLDWESVDASGLTRENKIKPVHRTPLVPNTMALAFADKIACLSKGGSKAVEDYRKARRLSFSPLVKQLVGQPKRGFLRDTIPGRLPTD